MALLSFKWLFTVMLGFFHPFYVSVTEINHNAKDKTLEVSLKVFADDMEEVLKKTYNKPVDLANQKQQAQNDGLITDYVTKHFIVKADGKPVNISYIGFEKEKESVYCYFEITNIPSIKKLELTNCLLQDLTEEQINIMHIIVGANRKSYKLEYPNKQASFNF